VRTDSEISLRLLRTIPPGKWIAANGHDRQALKDAVDEGLLLTCRRRYLGRPGRPATLYRLSTLGELAVYGATVSAAPSHWST